MSQRYVNDEQSPSARDRLLSPSESNDPNESSHPSASSYRPQYVTVGNGPESHNVTHLRAQLEDDARDSGYGSSIPDSFLGNESSAWRDSVLADRPIPAHTTSASSENDRRTLASHVHQLHYNQNRVALGRAINRTIETLKELQIRNAEWPAHYPSVQRSQPAHSHRPSISHTQSIRENTLRSNEPHDGSAHFRPNQLKRAGTSLGESSTAESSASAERRQTPEPRLITPQIAQEFSILKLDLKLGALSQAELVHSLEKHSIASLLDGKIGQSVRHLLALRDRIEDTSSKVLVTGDLNAGKSTFCNALLRRKILPEDQQPCTSIFCEVLDARENGGLEEAHAVHKNAVYNRIDESTFDVYSLEDLEKIVTDNDRYMQCKVYVKDVRTIDESLLNNGVVDIALIDAPGLNSDSVKTTAVFARQEEIDVVVFVVSAANHFTLSAKEFIFQAASEKAYIFMVVNGFDNIQDKERCQRMILEQIAKLSPRTSKEAAELVHFVSSNAIPVTTALPESSHDVGGGAGGSSSNPSDDEPESDKEDEPLGKHGEPGSPADKGKGKEVEREKIEDFKTLEGALRRFVLEKRARSKLAPAKTYLLNVLGDLDVLATVNQDVARSELDRVSKELSELEPAFEGLKRQRAEISEQLDKEADASCTDVYDHTRSTLSTTISQVGETNLGVEYPGLFSAFQFAEDLKQAMLDQIAQSVASCEDYGRAKCVRGVSMMKSLGLLHVGNEFETLNFRADKMFQRRKDALARTVETEVEIWDFFDIGGLWERQEKVVGTGMAMTVIGTLGSRAVGGVGWVDGVFGAVRVMGSNNLRRMVIPSMIATVILTTGYLLSTIPSNLPRRLARKLSATLSSMDYTHSNASRISSEVRRTLRIPAQRLVLGLQRSVEELQQKREDVNRIKVESDGARKYFTKLVRESREGKRQVEAVDLEGPLPGIAPSYTD
ncbi:MAG: hypothetical protein Q9160_001679 [Pyrenula sp. 1 TL-2023]